MNGLRITKKFISIYLTALLLITPAIFTCSPPLFADETYYDFSDEAQESFNRQEIIVPHLNTESDTNTENHKKKKSKRSKNEEQIEINQGPRLERSKKNRQDTEMIQPQEIILEPQSDIRNNPLQADLIYIKEGTGIYAMLQSTINSGSLERDDMISAVLVDDWVYNGKLIAPANSILYGSSVGGKKAGFLYTNGQIAISFNRLVLPNGDNIMLATNVVTMKKKSERTKKVAKHVVVGALYGILSGVFYALISGGDIGRGIAIGAGMGSASGALTASLHKGSEAEIPAGTVIYVLLTKPMKTIPYQY